MDTNVGMNTAAGPGLQAGRREWVGLAVLALPTLLVSIDVFVLLLALPHLSEDLRASSIQQLWITDIYGFMLSGFLVTMGTLGDRIGRRKLLLIGAAAFGVASALRPRQLRQPAIPSLAPQPPPNTSLANLVWHCSPPPTKPSPAKCTSPPPSAPPS